MATDETKTFLLLVMEFDLDWKEADALKDAPKPLISAFTSYLKELVREVSPVIVSESNEREQEFNFCIVTPSGTIYRLSPVNTFLVYLS